MLISLSSKIPIFTERIENTLYMLEPFIRMKIKRH